MAAVALIAGRPRRCDAGFAGASRAACAWLVPTIPAPAVDSMLNTMRSRIIHAILKEKFGPTASRIFRLLIDKQLLEQKQVRRAAAGSPRLVM